MSRSTQGYDDTDNALENLSDLEMASHLYGLSQAYQQQREQEALEKVQEQLTEYRKAKASGTRLDPVEEGTELWADICIYWDETGMYDMEGLAAVTPILATQADLGVNVEDTHSLDELEDVLEEGMDYFEPKE